MLYEEFQKTLPQNAFKQEEEKPGLEFNPDLALIVSLNIINWAQKSVNTSHRGERSQA